MSSSDLLEVPAVGADATANVNQTSPASAATQDRPLRAPANRESLVETVSSYNDLQENNNTLNDSPSSTRQRSHSKTRTNDKDGGEDVELDDLKPSNASHSPRDMLNATLLPHIDVEDNYMTSLPPPPPFDLEIEDLTIGVPTSSGGLPIFGKFFAKPAEDADGQPKAIVRNVSATCASGEMLAM